MRIGVEPASSGVLEFLLPVAVEIASLQVGKMLLGETLKSNSNTFYRRHMLQPLYAGGGGIECLGWWMKHSLLCIDWRLSSIGGARYI